MRFAHEVTAVSKGIRTGRVLALSIGLMHLFAPAAAFAHDVSEQAQQRMLDGGPVEAALIGAEHMLTGYDHLLFLLGVLFFLQGFWQIVRFITAFTLGHTITLLFATLLGISANAYLVDAVIALTVCYKAFENIGGFRRLGITSPNLLLMVFLFGLIHGFGLSTRLQQMALADDPGLVGKILSFNVGVELGQIAALAVMSLVVKLWRETEAWEPVSRYANLALLGAGFLLFAQQMSAWAQDDAAPQVAAAAGAEANG